jgi:hypothetical protein
VRSSAPSAATGLSNWSDRVVAVGAEAGFTERQLVGDLELEEVVLPSVYVVAPTGIDPVTFRFSVERSTN